MPGAAPVDLGYLGTYSADRQPKLERLLLEPARRWPAGRFAVAGPQYPLDTAWPANVARFEHLPAQAHRAFYGSQRFTLNLTRADMVAAGFSPSVRLFEAAACGIPIISDAWPGLETMFAPGREILLAGSADDVLRHLRELPEARRRAIGAAARARVLDAHTAAHRALELEALVAEAADRRAGGSPGALPSPGGMGGPACRATSCPGTELDEQAHRDHRRCRLSLGLRTTLTQPSPLARNVSYLSGPPQANPLGPVGRPWRP